MSKKLRIGFNVDDFSVAFVRLENDITFMYDAYRGPAEIDIFTAKVRDYCDAILKGHPAPIPGEEILYNQAICDGIYRSARLKREVVIDIPTL